MFNLFTSRMANPEDWNSCDIDGRYLFWFPTAIEMFRQIAQWFYLVEKNSRYTFWVFPGYGCQAGSIFGLTALVPWLSIRWDNYPRHLWIGAALLYFLWRSVWIYCPKNWIPLKKQENFFCLIKLNSIKIITWIKRKVAVITGATRRNWFFEVAKRLGKDGIYPWFLNVSMMKAGGFKRIKEALLRRLTAGNLWILTLQRRQVNRYKLNKIWQKIWKNRMFLSIIAGGLGGRF